MIKFALYFKTLNQVCKKNINTLKINETRGFIRQPGLSLCRAQLLTILLTTVLSACGGGGEKSPANQQNPDQSTGQPLPDTTPNTPPDTTPDTPPDTTPNPPPQDPNEPGTPAPNPPPQIVAFDPNQRSNNLQYRGAQVQSVAFANASGAFRLPLSGQNLTGNLTISVDLSDPDGINGVFVGFAGASDALALCLSACGNEYHRTVTGINPLDFAISDGPQRLELWIDDSQGNRTLVNTVDYNWQVTPVTGVNAARTSSNIDLSWDPLGSYLRYNVYVASQAGVTHKNYQSLADGEAFLALRDPRMAISGREDAKIFFTAVTGIDGSGESAFSDEVKIASMSGVVDLPPIAENDSFNVDEDTTLTGNLLANDSDLESATLIVDSNPVFATSNGQLIINSNGTFSYTPVTDFTGRDTFSYRISDGLGQTASAVVNIIVVQTNDAPDSSYNTYNVVDANATQSFETAARGTLTVAPPGLLINDLDIDSNGLSIVTTPVSSTTQGSLILNADGSFIYTSDTGATGEDQFTYQSTDGQGGTAQATVRITINGTSFPPIAANDRYSLTQDQTLVVNNSGTNTQSILSNDIDFDTNDTLTISQNLIRAPQHGTLNLSPDGTFTYIPVAGYFGVDYFIYEITDLQNNTAQAAGILTVNRQNQAPVTSPDAYAFDEDTTLTVNLANGVLNNDSDPDGDALIVDTSVLLAPATGQLTMASDGSFSYIPQANLFGAVSFQYQAVDSLNLSTVETVTLTINSVNDVPVANDDNTQTLADTLVNIQVLLNDTDVESQVLTVTAATTINGIVTIAADNSLNYTPPTGFVGTAEIDYSITDDAGATANAKVFVAVASANQAPVAVADSYTLNEDTLLSVDGNNLPLLTANDSDPDSDPLSVDTTPFIGATNGIVTLLTDGTFNYQPNQNFFGSDSFSYRLSDGQGGTATASVTLTINPVNDNPVANNDSASTAEETLINIAVLGNDSDIENNPLRVFSATADNGVVSIATNNTLDYLPSLNFVGTDLISYSIEDGNQGTATGFVSVSVSNTNDAPTANDDTASTDQGVPVNINVLANDTDIDGDTLVILSAIATNGTVTINNNISLTYTSLNNFSGTDVINYTISDNNGGNASATVTVSVINLNSPPTAINDTATTNEDTLANINVLANDTDPDGDNLTVISTSATNGAVTIQADNSLNYQPNSNFNGTDTITYQINDPSGATSSANVTVTVTPVNDAPVAVVDIATTDEDTEVFIDVLSNDSDIDSPTLTLDSASANNGTTTVIGNLLNYLPNANFNGTDTLNYTVSDGAGGTASSTVTVTIIPVNDPPIALSDSATSNEDTTINIDVLANDSDPDNDVLSINTASANNGTVAVNTNNTLDYTPGTNFNGDDIISYQISDSHGSTASATVTVTVAAVNDQPVAVNDSATTDEDVTVQINVLTNDSDLDNDTLIVAAATATNGTVDFTSNSNFISYSPTANFNGNDTINYTIDDGKGGSASAQVAVTIIPTNDFPVATADTATTNEDQTATINVLSNDSDVDGDTLTVSILSNPGSFVTVNPDQTLNYQPLSNFNGNDVIGYQISDGNGGIANSTLTVIVTAVNDNPTPVADIQTTDEDTSVNINVLLNDSDIDGDTLTISTTSPANASNGTVVTETNNTLTYAPNANFNGSDIINYTVSDGFGGTASSTVVVTVTPVNDLPVANADTAITDEDVLVSIDVLSNDTDADGEALTVTVANSANSSITINNNIVQYTPNANYHGTDVIDYTIEDGSKITASSQVTVIVGSIEDSPTAVADVQTTNEDVAVDILVLSNDFDGDGDTITIATGTAAPTATNGIVLINNDNSLKYTPNANFFGSDTINYTITDTNSNTASTTVAVTVNSLEDIPVAVNDTISATEDTAIDIAVLANDSDGDGDVITISGTPTATNGSVSVNSSQTLSYQPNANYHGSDVISYTIEDSKNNTATAIVNVTVAAVNDKPVAIADIATTNEDVAVNIVVLSNDTDVDGDTLLIKTTPTALNGSVVVVSNTTLDYFPNSNFFGTDTITYTVDDSNGGTATGSVTVTVDSVNDSPIAISDSGDITEDATNPLVVNVLANDSDVDGDTFTVTAATTAGTASVSFTTSSVSYTPSANFFGIDTINYTITDAGGATGNGTITVTVTEVNDNPVAVADILNINEDVSSVIQVLTNDSDVDGDPLIVETNSVTASQGSVSVVAGTGISYTPNSNYFGNDTINYQVSDGRGGSATATVAVTVNSVEDLPVAVADAQSTAEDTATTIDVLLNDSDGDGDTLTISGTPTASNGSVTIDRGTLNYSPNANFFGSDTIDYAITDGKGTASSTVTVSISPVPDAPIAVADTHSLNEDTSTNISVLANDSDADGDTITISSNNLTAGNGSVAVTGTTVSYTPNTNFNGSDTINYTITDGALTASSTVTVNVISVNDPPVAVADTTSTSEDTPLTGIIVLSNDSDPEGDTFSLTTALATNGNASVIGSATIDYTPNANFNGADTISYTITDAGGATATSSVTVNISAVNDAPVGVPDAETVIEDTLKNIIVLANDTDIDGDTLAISGTPSALHGTATVGTGNTIDYTPDSDYFGTDTITYSVSDGFLSDSTTVAINVTGVNDNPVAVVDIVTVNEDSTTNIDVLNNDTDPDGNLLDITNNPLATNGIASVVNNNGPKIAYTPNANFNGSDTITYNIHDNNGGTASSSVTVTVNAVNDNPVANNDSATVNEDTLINLNVLVNDTDIEGNTLSIDSANVSHGTYTIEPNKTINYTPASNYNGPDTLNYSISDGAGGTASASVALTITAVNDPPIVVADNASTNEDVLKNIDVLSNDSDPDGGSLTVNNGTASAINGAVTVKNDNTLDYVPNPNYNGTDTISFDVQNATLSTASTVTVNVSAVNDAPTISGLTTSIAENSANTTPVTTMTGSDVDGDPLTYSIVTDPSTIFAIDSNSGQLSIGVSPAPLPNFEAAVRHEVVIKVQDPDGLNNTATAIVNITNVIESAIPTIDTTFGTQGTAGSNAFATEQFDHPNASVLDAAGKLVVVGKNDYSTIGDVFVARFNTDGTVDRTFGYKGVFIHDLGAHEEAIAVAIDSNNKIVITGNQTNGSSIKVFTMRLTSVGALDTTFNGGSGSHLYGEIAVQAIAVDAKLDASNNIIIAAHNVSGDFNVIKFSADGTTHVDGTVSFPGSNSVASALLLQSDGKALIVGTVFDSPTLYDFGIARFDVSTTPTLDTSYNGDGKASFDFGNSREDMAYAAHINTTNEVVIAGSSIVPSSNKSDFAALKIDADGNLISSFGTNGLLKVDIDGDADAGTNQSIATAMAADSNNNLYFAINKQLSNFDTVIYQTDASGNEVSAYGTGGQVTFSHNSQDNTAEHLLIDSSNRAALLTTTTTNVEPDMLVARFTTAGVLDTTFSDDGFNTLDPTFSIDSLNEIIELTVAPNVGKFAAVGTSGSGNGSKLIVTRFNADGSTDETFGINGYYLHTGVETTITGQDIVEQSDGKLVAAGSFDADGLVVRIQTTGMIDGTFGSGGAKVLTCAPATMALTAVSIDKNSKLVVAGTASNVNNNIYMARLNFDGSLDTSIDADPGLSFNGSAGFIDLDMGSSESIYDIATLSDGSIIAVGQKGINGLIVKILENGTLDSAGFAPNDGYISMDLSPDFGSNIDILKRVKIKSDGKIVAAGYTTNPIANVVIQLNGNGSIDTAFDTDGIASYDYGSGDAKTLALTFDATENILITGLNRNASNDDDIFVGRITATGAADPLFNGATGGILFPYDNNQNEMATAIIARADGTIIIAGADNLNLFPTSFFFVQKLKLVEP